MTVKIGETYRFEGVVEEAHPAGSAGVKFAGGDKRTLIHAAEMAAATLIEKPYEPAVGDVVTWGGGQYAARVLWADEDGALVDDGKLRQYRERGNLTAIRRLPPETPLGPIAASQEGDDGWIEWDGGPAPVAGKIRVEARFRDGRTKCTRADDLLNWNHGGYRGDVVAYRLAKADRP